MADVGVMPSASKHAPVPLVSTATTGVEVVQTCDGDGTAGSDGVEEVVSVLCDCIGVNCVAFCEGAVLSP